MDHDQYSTKELIAQFVIPALDDLRSSAEARDRKYMATFDKQEQRINGLEAWRNKGIGAIAIITGLLIPIAVPVVITLLSAGAIGALLIWF